MKETTKVEGTEHQKEGWRVTAEKELTLTFRLDKERKVEGMGERNPKQREQSTTRLGEERKME